jgi:hypothetical protein
MCFKIFHFHSGFTYLTDWQNNAKIMTRTTPEILSFITYNYITSTPLRACGLEIPLQYGYGTALVSGGLVFY